MLGRGADAARSAAFFGAVIAGHGEIARLLLPLTESLQELREAAGVLGMHGSDEELLAAARGGG